MSFTIRVDYQGQPLTYEILLQEEGVYQLRLDGNGEREKYVPEKIIIRRKGKIWVSDCENCQELVESLTREILRFNSGSEIKMQE